jgi:hypothetical protein
LQLLLLLEDFLGTASLLLDAPLLLAISNIEKRRNAIKTDRTTTTTTTNTTATTTTTTTTTNTNNNNNNNNNTNTATAYLLQLLTLLIAVVAEAVGGRIDIAHVTLPLNETLDIDGVGDNLNSLRTIVVNDLKSEK